MAKNLPQVRRDKGFVCHEEKNESSLFESGLKKIFHSKEFADCKFLVGKDKVCFEAHKLVLAMASEVLKLQVILHATAEPILIPDVDPSIFECIIRYIYLNQSPLEGLGENKATDQEIQVIKLWYASSKFQLRNLTKKCYDMIKINVKNWFHVYVSSKRLLKCGHLRQDSDVKTLISRCHKVFSVKTPEALDESHFTNQNIPVVYLKVMFATEEMNVESELDLFRALVKYANEYGWQPNGQFLIEEDNNGVKQLTQFQKSIREAMKQIRFLTMTLTFSLNLKLRQFVTELQMTAHNVYQSLDLRNKRLRDMNFFILNCLKSDANYSQMKPIKLEEKVKICHMKLAISPHHVSYKNKRSNVSATYGKDVRDYE